MESALVPRKVAPTETPFLLVEGLPTEPEPGPALPAAKKIRQMDAKSEFHHEGPRGL
jgi:hypothetical protein